MLQLGLESISLTVAGIRTSGENSGFKALFSMTDLR
jgi:hypothetical protein